MAASVGLTQLAACWCLASVQARKAVCTVQCSSTSKHAGQKAGHKGNCMLQRLLRQQQQRLQWAASGIDWQADKMARQRTDLHAARLVEAAGAGGLLRPQCLPLPTPPGASAPRPV